MGPRKVKPVPRPEETPSARSARRPAHRRHAAPRTRLATSLAVVVLLGAAVGLAVRFAIEGHPPARNAAHRASTLPTTAAPRPTSATAPATTARPPQPVTPSAAPTTSAATTVPPPTTAPATTVTPTSVPATTAVAPLPSGDVLVEVLNGSGATGLAAETATALHARGFRVNGTGNAPTYTFVDNVVEYSTGSAPAARAVAAELTGGTVLRVVAGLVANEVDLVVGSSFRGLVGG